MNNKQPQQTTFKNKDEVKNKTIKVNVTFFKGKTFVDSKGKSNYKDMLIGSEIIEVDNLERFLTQDTLLWAGYYINLRLLSSEVANNPKYLQHHHIGVSIPDI